MLLVGEKFAFNCKPSASIITNVLHVVNAFVAFPRGILVLDQPGTYLFLTSVKVANVLVCLQKICLQTKGPSGFVALTVTTTDCIWINSFSNVNSKLTHEETPSLYLSLYLSLSLSLTHTP